jgi:hypothetical protein
MKIIKTIKKKSGVFITFKTIKNSTINFKKKGNPVKKNKTVIIKKDKRGRLFKVP